VAVAVPMESQMRGMLSKRWIGDRRSIIAPNWRSIGGTLTPRCAREIALRGRTRGITLHPADGRGGGGFGVCESLLSNGRLTIYRRSALSFDSVILRRSSCEINEGTALTEDAK
jgi:hypothetical protein